jgi:DNA helicase-2/ATP-dependent DNA helicase PcrA
MSRRYVLQRSRPPVDPRIDYAAELNAQQLAAVTADPGPALVLAGAGAGKTRTLTYRVAYLIEQGIPPKHILLLTFTNKAAREMMNRVTELLGREMPELWGGTFHSVGNRLLRRHGERLGYRPGFTILDREDARDLVHACLGEADIDVKATRFPKADVLTAIFSLAVNTARPIPEVLEQRFPFFAGLAEPIADIARRYAERKRENNVMDFDDLLALWLRLFREHEDVRGHYQRRWQYVLVDVYQDTNRLQNELIELIAARHHNVMAVGDDSQSIYSWRGANFQNILRFPERQPGARVYRIETNYRSTPEILAVANAAIAANVNQHEKRLQPARPSGVKPALIACADAYEQAAFVAQRVLELRDEGVPLEQMAVLYRAHFHAMELQMELTQRNIPFSITSGIRFFEQAHIKDIAAFIKFLFNPRDEMAFKRLALMMPGIGAKSAAKLWRQLLPALGHPPAAPTPADADAPPPLAAALQGLTVPKKARTAWAQFTATLAQLEAPALRDNPAEMIGVILDALYEDHLRAKYENSQNRLDDVRQLAEFARKFSGPEEFLSQLALLTNTDTETQAAREPDSERLHLSSVHQAKGLEFDVVFVIMLCEGMFPSGRSLDTDEGLEEERRLFYVAITRARNELYLTHPFIRQAGGGDAFQEPSRFLGELPRESLESWDLTTAPPDDPDWNAG